MHSLKKLVLIALIALVTITKSIAASGDRKLLVVGQTEYPQFARQMRITGAVKFEATVLPNGKVRDLRLVGGHPLLVDAARKSAAKFEYEPTDRETTQTIVVNFTDGQ